MEEVARQAGVHDVDRVVHLASLLRSELAGERGGALWVAADVPPAHPELVGRWIGDPAIHVVVGGLDDVLLGYAVVRAVDLRDGSRLGVVDELFVEGDAREVGIGEVIVDEVLRWCRERRCRGIDASALPGMRNTKNFFEGSGFVTRRLVMHRSLAEE